ncbi:putative ribonuclease, partial [Cercophora samala]
MARTRSKGGAASTSADKTASTTAKAASTPTYTLPAESTNPPKLFVLPKNVSSSARVITLENPRYGKPTRYLVCPETGSFYEFTKVAPPNKSTPRSWLLSSDTEKESTLESQTIQSPDLYLATPYDPLFLLLPALFKSAPSSKSDNQQGQYLSLDDYLDLIPNTDRHFSEILTLPDSRVEKALEARLASVCDVVEMGDDKMYRPNATKLSTIILSKARKMAEKLPPSMEEKFIKKALEAPVMGIVRDQPPQPPPPSADTSPEDSTSESQTTTSITTTPSTTPTTPATTEPPEPTFAPAITPSPTIISLQRLRTSLNFILSSYLPPPVSKTVQSSLPNDETFAALEEYLEQLSKLRAEAAASRSNDINGGKRSRDEDEDERLEKKRKMEQEEKVKKANTSRGVKQLAKVNTQGMMKLSAFFKKK